MKEAQKRILSLKASPFYPTQSRHLVLTLLTRLVALLPLVVTILLLLFLFLLFSVCAYPNASMYAHILICSVSRFRHTSPLQSQQPNIWRMHFFQVLRNHDVKDDYEPIIQAMAALTRQVCRLL